MITHDCRRQHELNPGLIICSKCQRAMEIEAIARRVTWKNGPIPLLEVRVEATVTPDLQWTVIYRVAERDTGEPFRLYFVELLPAPPEALEGKELVRYVVAMMQAHTLSIHEHEAREAFHFDGVRVDDPHQGDG